MKRTAIIAAIAAITGTTAPYAVAELNENSTLQDIISFTNGLDQRATSAYAKAEEGTTIRAEHDRRMNVQSDRIYKSQLTASSAPHYDGDKVVTTDRDLTDTITGAVMLDEQGNALKVRELQKGTDDITLRGEGGTGLHNVSAGTDDRDAVNVSQLKGTAQGLQDSIDGHSETLKALDSAQQKESQDRIAGYNANSDRITDVAEHKADKSDVNEVRSTLSQSTAERIATDADHDSKIADLYDTKANAAEVNEWLETKADKDQVVAAQSTADDAAAAADKANDGVARLDGQKADKRAVEIAQGTASFAVERAFKAENAVSSVDDRKADKSALNSETMQRQYADAKAEAALADHDQRISNAQAGADSAGAAAAAANDGVARLDDQKADKTAVATVQESADEARRGANVAKYTADAAVTETRRLDAVKADKTQLAEVQRSADKTSQRYAADAERSANAYTYEKSAQQRQFSEQVARSWGVHAMDYADYGDEETLNRSKEYTDAAASKASARMDGIEHQQKRNQRETRGGVAGVAAMANIPNAREIGRMSLGAGTGFYKDSAALAVGGSYRFNRAVTVKGSISTTGADTVAGAGVSYEF